METAVESLVGMGFPKVRAEKALAITGGSAQQAMDWIFAHEGDADIDEPYVAPVGNTLGGDASQQAAPTAASTAGAAAGGGGGASMCVEADSDAGASNDFVPTAQSLKCLDCGKMLRDNAAAQTHAARTKHANFEQCTEAIKPLTAEEKAAQFQKLQEKISEKKKARVDTEAREALEKEKMRRTSGKDVGQLRADHERNEAIKQAAIRKKDKLEVKRAKERVKAEIAKDKAERKAAADAKKNPAAAAAAVAAQASASAMATEPDQPKAAKVYTQCRIQVRAQGAKPLSNNFKPEDTLGDVFAHVRANLAAAPAAFSLNMTRPTKVFTDADAGLTLQDAGLMPSAALMLRPL